MAEAKGLTTRWVKYTLQSRYLFLVVYSIGYILYVVTIKN